MTKQEKEVYAEVSAVEICMLCNQARGQERHHIRYGACGRHTYRGNVILLCNECHDLVHSNKKKYQPILIKIIDDYLKGDESK
jgi:5-methylcytosine-specific restriction endonuclease McrA